MTIETIRKPRNKDANNNHRIKKVRITMMNKFNSMIIILLLANNNNDPRANGNETKSCDSNGDHTAAADSHAGPSPLARTP